LIKARVAQRVRVKISTVTVNVLCALKQDIGTLLAQKSRNWRYKKGQQMQNPPAREQGTNTFSYFEKPPSEIGEGNVGHKTQDTRHQERHDRKECGRGHVTRKRRKLME